jgi:c-di-GMP-binding flagellar brake protein YcgR
MGLLHFRRVERRRTARATMCMNVLVYGQNTAGEKFRYWTRTLSVSAHGGVLSEAALDIGQSFHLINEYNGKKASARIVAVRSTKDGQVQASFEFAEGGDHFWSMCFPAAGAKPLRRFVARVVDRN